MNSTNRGNRKHIVFYGKRNVGKSSLMNKILGQEVSLVSDIKGTTTDPVSKAMELLPFGPVLLIDTGGIDDYGELGMLRVEKTKNTLNIADLAIYVLDGENIEDEYFHDMIDEIKSKEIPYIVVVNKRKLLTEDEIDYIYSYMDDIKFIFTDKDDNFSIEKLKKKIISNLEVEDELDTFIGDLVRPKGKIILVVDNDTAAPKGRLILPQVQILRDALDNGIKSYMVRKEELESALEDLEDVDLVITDSKIFKEVDEIIDGKIKLTSFSILMARDKGDLSTFIEGVKSLNNLRSKDNIKILISEACTHSTTHEDIGQVKIPNMLRNYFNKDVSIVFKSGNDFEVEEDIDLVIHCGACMLNKRNMESRINLCRSKNIPITNYGIFISYILGILDRAIEIF